MRLIKRYAEFRPRDEVCLIPHHTRGIYFLLNYHPRLKKYHVSYVGMSAKPKAGIGGRLRMHAKSGRKVWTHFSIYEVSDRLDEGQIRELEGLVINFYRKDSRVHKYNAQKKTAFLKKVRVNDLRLWSKHKYT